MAPLPLAQIRRDGGQYQSQRYTVATDIWIYFNLVSNTILLPILVVTFLVAPRVKKRHPTLVNVCMTWILSGIFSLLLFYAGQEMGPEPSKPLCIVQTTLLYGITPMWAVAVLILLYNMLLSMDASEGPASIRLSGWKMIAMLSAPYLTQLAFSIATLIGALKHPEEVTRHRRVLYCDYHSHTLSLARSIFTGVAGVGVLVFMVRLGIRLRRTWHVMRHAGRPSGFNTQLLLRVLIFSAYVVFGMAVNIVSMTSPKNLLPEMYAATVGTVVFLVFGTQGDVLRTWAFWLKDAPKEPAAIYIPRELMRSWTLDLTKTPLPPPRTPVPQPRASEDSEGEEKVSAENASRREEKQERLMPLRPPPKAARK